MLREVTFHLANGRQFRIITEGLSERNRHIISATLNGKNYPYSALRHATLMEGGTLILKMGDKPGEWGKRMFKEEK